MKKPFIYTLSAALLFLSSAFSQVTQDWSKSFANQFADAPLLTTTDISGNAYIAGTTGDDVNWTIDGMTLGKFDNTGNLVWSAFYPDFTPYSIIVDATGGVILAGSNDEETSQTQTFSMDAIIVKFDSNGLLLWDYYLATSVDESFHTVTVDSGGDIYCAGKTGGDALLVKLNSAGQQLWLNSYATSNYEGFNKVVEKSGFLYLAGGGRSAIAAKYNATTGNQVWVSSYGPANTYNNFFVDLAVDDNDNVFATGGTNILSAKKMTPTSKRQYDFLTVKYNVTGVLQWVKTYDGSADDTFDNVSMSIHIDEAKGIALDAAGNPVVAGYAYNKSGSGKNTASSYDVVLIKYSSAGTQTFVKVYGTASDYERLYAVASDITGMYLTGQGSNSAFTLKYDYSGNLAWDMNFSNNGLWCRGRSITVSGNETYVAVMSDSMILVKYADAGVSPRLSLNEVNNSAINIYPNPTTDVIYLNSQKEIGLVTITDIAGKILNSEIIYSDKAQINLLHLQQGIYFIQSVTSGKTEKIIKK